MNNNSGNRYCEICELDQPFFTPKCYTKKEIEEERQPQVCKKCHARFCTHCRLKPFLVEFIDVK